MSVSLVSKANIGTFRECSKFSKEILMHGLRIRDFDGITTCIYTTKPFRYELGRNETVIVLVRFKNRERD